MKAVYALGAPLFLIIVALPLYFNLIPRNRFYGFRTSESLSNDGLWFQFNEWLGLALIVAGVVGFVLAALLANFDLGLRDSTRGWLSVIGTSIVSLIGTAAVFVVIDHHMQTITNDVTQTTIERSES